MKKLIKLLEQVGGAFGPSGREMQVREVIAELAKPYVDEIETDTLGNLICHKKGNGKKVMLTAHMDSIGVVATFIDENGFIRFAPVGGLFRGDLINIQIVFANGTRGVISYEEKTPFKDLTLDQLFIDIGAQNRAEAEKMVQVGDFAVFSAPYFAQNEVLCGPYLDNRIGCIALLLAMQQLTATENDLFFVFSVQEEVGLRGAGAAAFAVTPDIALAVDVTDTGDLPEQKAPMAVRMGQGPAIKIMDHSVVCAPQVREWLEQTAKVCKIPVQQEILRFGGTDTAALQKTKSGVLAGAVSIPTRYIHSPSEMCHAQDVMQAAKLLAATVCGKLS